MSGACCSVRLSLVCLQYLSPLRELNQSLFDRKQTINLHQPDKAPKSLRKWLSEPRLNLIFLSSFICATTFRASKRLMHSANTYILMAPHASLRFSHLFQTVYVNNPNKTEQLSLYIMSVCFFKQIRTFLKSHLLILFFLFWKYNTNYISVRWYITYSPLWFLGFLMNKLGRWYCFLCVLSSCDKDGTNCMPFWRRVCFWHPQIWAALLDFPN